jgi:DNA-binding transcriptional ArsR family regulator
VKLKKDLLGLCLVLTLAVSLAAVLERQKEADSWAQTTKSAIQRGLSSQAWHLIVDCPVSNSYLLSTWTTRVTPAFAEKAPLPDNSTRTEILNFIAENPGVQFRAICAGLGLSIGVVQFHVGQLLKNALITSHRKGRYKRFFTGKFSRAEMEAISAARLGRVRCILKALLEGKALSHRELAERAGISSQGLTWQMNRLRETGFVEETRDGLRVSYEVNQKWVALVSSAIELLEN